MLYVVVYARVALLDDLFVDLSRVGASVGEAFEDVILVGSKGARLANARLPLGSSLQSRVLLERAAMYSKTAGY